MNRRRLTPFQRIELQYKLETIENEIGKAANRMSDGGKIGAEILSSITSSLFQKLSS